MNMTIVKATKTTSNKFPRHSFDDYDYSEGNQKYLQLNTRHSFAEYSGGNQEVSHSDMDSLNLFNYPLIVLLTEYI